MNRNANKNNSSLELHAIVNDICSILRQKKWRMGTAESCTGGGIAKVITDVPGVSDFFAGGVVAYSNDVKNRLLGVGLETLNTYGAVSSEAAKEMLFGLVKQLDLQAGISVTGIAGPGGGTDQKPIGLVYISTYVLGNYRYNKFHFANGRSSIRKEATLAALDLLQRHLFERTKG